MAENTLNENAVPEEQEPVQSEETASLVTDDNTDAEAEEETYDIPTGAVVFTGLMLIAYIGYYMFHWFEIFVMRGA